RPADPLPMTTVDRGFAPLAPPRAAPSVAPRRERGLWRDAWYRLTRNRAAVVGLVFVVLLLLIALFASALAPYSFDRQDLGSIDQASGGLFGVFVALGLVSWLTVARLVRGQVLSLKEKEFVEAARMVGATNVRVMTRHLLPNSLAPIIVAATFGIPLAIAAEAGLSFL